MRPVSVTSISRRAEPRLRQDAAHVAGEARVRQLSRRDIHRKQQIVRPVARVRAGLAQHAVEQRANHAGLFGDADELLRAYFAASRMAPAGEHLEADQFLS